MICLHCGKHLASVDESKVIRSTYGWYCSKKHYQLGKNAIIATLTITVK